MDIRRPADGERGLWLRPCESGGSDATPPVVVTVLERIMDGSWLRVQDSAGTCFLARPYWVLTREQARLNYWPQANDDHQW